MTSGANPGFWRVARREVQWLVHDRVALILIFGVPLFAFVVLTAVFSHPVIRGLGVTVVDEDRSDSSRALVEYIAASPSLAIVDRAGDLSTAARDIRSGRSIAAVYIPADFERDLKAGRRPQIVGFYNQQYLTAAGVASSGLSDTLSAAAAVAAPAGHAAPAAVSVGQLTGETIVLVNPQKNYAQFLLRALLPMIIHVVITLAAGYSVGSEFHRRNAREWLESAGGDPIAALAGKLAPLFVIFVLIMLAEPFVLEGFFQIPFKGAVPMMVAAGSLLIIAHLSLGALLQLLTFDLASGLGLAGIVVSPAFGYAGVGFPTLGMNAFAQTWSAILPVRWYMAVLMGQAARGLPPSDSAFPFAILAGLALLYAALALLRMSAVQRSRRFDTLRTEEAEIIVPRRGVGGAFAAEWRRVLSTRSAFSLLFLAPLIYGVYYPQPYLNQILRKMPIAVVDNDLTELSRQIVDTLDASNAVNVTVRARTLVDAKAAIDRGEAYAAVEIPPGAERDMLKGLAVHVPIYADATYMFILRSTASGIGVAIGALTNELVARGARTDGSLAKAKLASLSPADVLLQPLFNPVGGYASYVVPAAFLLILQQTLLIGSAMLTRGALAQQTGSTISGVFGRGVAHMTIYLPALALYLVVLPHVYGFSMLGSLGQAFALGLVFLLATSFLGQAIGAWFTQPENATLVLIATSLPQFFTMGFSWPREALSPAARALGRVFPADFAIDGIVRINQLGANIWDVLRDWSGLWWLVLIYFALAVVSAFAAKRRQTHAQA
jgi:ABC-2 type transport system permease protein